MPHYSELKGVIFDVDDTLLSNYPKGSHLGLHERSRLAAAHEVGKRFGSLGLQNFTDEQCTEAFLTAKAHTLQAAVWQMLIMAGEVTSDVIEPHHPLLHEIMQLKDELHEEILRVNGREVPGAIQFVQTLAASGLKGKLAIASTAYRRDIDIFLEMTQLNHLFSEEKIISRERFTQAKPHPEAYHTAFKTLCLPEKFRSYVAAFEDDPRGILSAKAAGLFTCAITTRFDRETFAALEVAPDVVADSYAEFTAYFGLPILQLNKT